jgi:hypothetical protein
VSGELQDVGFSGVSSAQWKVVPDSSAPSTMKLKLTFGVLTVPSGPDVIFTVRVFVGGSDAAAALTAAAAEARTSSVTAAIHDPLLPLGTSPMLERWSARVN